MVKKEEIFWTVQGGGEREEVKGRDTEQIAALNAQFVSHLPPPHTRRLGARYARRSPLSSLFVFLEEHGVVF